MRKKLFAVLICMFVVLTQLPFTALADEQGFTVTCEVNGFMHGLVRVSNDNTTWSYSVTVSSGEKVAVKVDCYIGWDVSDIVFADMDNNILNVSYIKAIDNNSYVYFFDMPPCNIKVWAVFFQPKYSVDVDANFADKNTKVIFDNDLPLYPRGNDVNFSINKPVPEGYTRQIIFKDINGKKINIELNQTKSGKYYFSMPKKDIIISITDKLKEYKIDFSLDGGEINDGDLIEYDSQSNPYINFNAETDTFALPIPTKENCIFAGWFTNSDFNTLPVTNITKGTNKSFKLYAKWVNEIPNPFNIISQPDDWTYNSDKPNSNAFFCVEANADDLLYQWQFYNGLEWVNCEHNGYNSATLKVPKIVENIGYYRCIINDGYHYEVSDVVAFMRQTYSVTLDTSEARFLNSTDFNTELYNPDGLPLYIPGEEVYFDCSDYYENSGYRLQIEVLNSSGQKLDIPVEYPEIEEYQEVFDYYFVMPQEDVILRFFDEKSNNEVMLNFEGGVIYSDKGYVNDKLVFNFDVESETIELPIPERDGYYFSGWFTELGTWPITTIEKGTTNGIVLIAEWIKYIPEEFHITKQPVSYIGKPNKTHCFSVETEGGQYLSYRWQYNSGNGWKYLDFVGSDSPTVTLSTSSFYSKCKYRCVIYDGYHFVFSNVVGITLSDTVQVTSHPKDYSGLIGSYAEFSVKAKGDDLKYQWQYQNAKGVWKNSNAAGSDTSTMSIKITDARDGQKYRCVITQGEESVTTDEAAIHAIRPITIQTQPTDYSGKAGEIAKFSVVAEGEELNYQWQYQNAKGTWKNSNSTGSNTSAMEIKITATRDGQKYRCVITDKDNNKIISGTAAIQVAKPESVITAQPVDFTGTVGATAVFSVETAEGDYSYQWQYSKDGITWKNSNSAGYNTASMSVKITEARAGQMYRCVIKGADIKETSEVAKIILVEPQQITISTQPQNYEGALGENAVFTVAAEGEGLTYQWQYSKDGATWRNSSSNGYNTASLSVEITEKRDGQQYRCVVSDGRTKVTSDAASVILVKQVEPTEPVEPPIVITKQPQDCYCYDGEEVEFSVEAKGADLSYCWTLTTDFGSEVFFLNENTSVLTYVVEKGYDNFIGNDNLKVRCKITDKYGNFVYSEYATIHVTKNENGQSSQPDNPDNPVEPAINPN